MAAALEHMWPGSLEGIVVTRYGYATPYQRMEIVEATHPAPDAAGETAARRKLKRVQVFASDYLPSALIGQTW
jgi:hydroxypyruvate reductase